MEVKQVQIASPVAEIPTEDLKKTQEDGQVTGNVQQYVMAGQWPRLRGGDHREDTSVIRKSPARAQLVLPSTDHQLIYKELYEEMGHLVVEQTFILILDCFYWPDLQMWTFPSPRCVAA